MKKIVLLIAFYSIHQVSSAQEDQYMNKYGSFFQNSFNENPAVAGLTDSSNIYINYQSLWPSSNINHNQLYVAYDALIGKNKNLGLGIYNLTYSDDIKTTFTFDVSLALHFDLGTKKQLSIGLDVLNYSRNNYKGITSLFTEVKDDLLIADYEHIYADYLNTNIGIWYSRNWIYTSLSFQNINQFYNVFKKSTLQLHGSPKPIPNKIQCLVGAELNVSKNLLLQPILKISKSKNELIEVQPSIYLNDRRQFIYGISSHNLRTLELIFGVEFLKRIELGTSVALPINNLWDTYKIAHLKFYTLYHLQK